MAAVDEHLAAARARIAPRVSPAALGAELAAGALVVDIRPEEARDREGALDGALVVERTVLEWRLDPTSPHRVDRIQDPGQRVVIVCNEGYASSLAAAVLRDLGLTNVTDLEGGYRAL
jgi:rhodanese-related sulfurtransferase